MPDVPRAERPSISQRPVLLLDLESESKARRISMTAIVLAPGARLHVEIDGCWRAGTVEAVKHSEAHVRLDPS